MADINGALLFHETVGKTVFKTPRRYEVIESAGEFKKESFVVLNNLPVTEEGKPLFEHQFKNRAKLLEHAAGFTALRVLRPVSSAPYIILTVWENEASYKAWKSSTSFFEAHTNKGIINNNKPKIFESAPYTSTYVIPE